MFERRIFFSLPRCTWECILLHPCNICIPTLSVGTRYADTKKVNVDFPQWMIESLDREAKRIGVTRQSIIKVWIAERLKKEADGLQAS